MTAEVTPLPLPLSLPPPPPSPSGFLRTWQEMCHTLTAVSPVPKFCPEGEDHVGLDVLGLCHAGTIRPSYGPLYPWAMNKYKPELCMDDPKHDSKQRKKLEILIALWLERHGTVLSARCTDLRGISTGRHQWEGGTSQEGRVMMLRSTGLRACWKG